MQLQAANDELHQRVAAARAKMAAAEAALAEPSELEKVTLSLISHSMPAIR